MPKLKLVINEGDDAETIKQRLITLFKENKETLAPYHALDYVEGLENLEADGQCMFSEDELHDLVYALGKIVSTTHKGVRPIHVDDELAYNDGFDGVQPLQPLELEYMQWWWTGRGAYKDFTGESLPVTLAPNSRAPEEVNKT